MMLSVGYLFDSLIFLSNTKHMNNKEITVQISKTLLITVQKKTHKNKNKKEKKQFNTIMKTMQKKHLLPY